MRVAFVRERRRRRHHPKKPKNLFVSTLITIETLKTTIVFVFFSVSLLDTKKGTKVLSLPSEIHTQCSDIYTVRF